MADAQLQTILNSGSISNINIGGTASTDKVLKADGSIAQVKTAYIPATSPISHVEGQMYYDSGRESMIIQTPYSGVEIRVGHGMHTHVINNSGAVIEKGMACRHDGVTAGGLVKIVKAVADTFEHALVFGVAAHDIQNGAEGSIVTFGEIDSLNTSALSAGIPLFLSDTVPGTYTAIAPDIVSRVGGVTVSDATSGTLFVAIINNDNIPTVFGSLKDQSGSGLYSLTTTAQDIVSYGSESHILISPNITTGILTLPNTGEYRVHFTASIAFTSVASTRTVFIELYDIAGAAVSYTFAKNIPRDATIDSFSFSWASSEIAGNSYKLRIYSNTTMDVTFSNISFEMESINIR